MSKIITTHLLLDATVDRVWQTLTDLAGYHRVEPVHHRRRRHHWSVNVWT